MVRPKKEIDIAELERLAGLGLSVKEIAWCLGINPSTFYEHQKTKPEFSEAIERGRAKTIAKCAQTILNAATKLDDPKIALEYLKRHGERWREIKQELEIAHSGGVNQSKLDEVTQTRMCAAFLKTKRWGLEPPEDCNIVLP